MYSFCLTNSIWSEFDYQNGYIGSFYENGFNSPLIIQISELFFSLWENEQISHPETGERFCVQCHNPVSFVTGEDLSDYKEARFQAYGDAVTQIEYITENGLDAWQTNVATIKSNYPKPE